MQIIKGKTNIDFISKRRIALLISSLLNLGVLVGIAIFGFNLGVDFAGGTLVEVKFKEPISADAVREAGNKGDLHDLTVQRIGADDDASFLLRMGGTTQLTPDAAVKAEMCIRDRYRSRTRSTWRTRGRSTRSARATRAARSAGRTCGTCSWRRSWWRCG